MIEARLADLRAGLAKLQSDLISTDGAIQDCLYWLSQAEAPVLVEVPED